MAQNIAQAIVDIRQEIDNAAAAAGRHPDDITLVAVSKKQPDDRIDAALASGLRIFGENRVQEAEQRWAHRRATCPDLVLRLIGPLQTNKAAPAVALFDVIETLDREKLAQALAGEMEKQGKRRDCLIQVNTGEEDQKSGISPKEAVAFSHFCRADLGLEIKGFMCIPPVTEEAAMHFALLAKLARQAGLPQLSMGMSADFPEAIRFGATHIRVGSRLFGERSAA